MSVIGRDDVVVYWNDNHEHIRPALLQSDSPCVSIYSQHWHHYKEDLVRRYLFVANYFPLKLQEKWYRGLFPYLSHLSTGRIDCISTPCRAKQ